MAGIIATFRECENTELITLAGREAVVGAMTQYETAHDLQSLNSGAVKMGPQRDTYCLFAKLKRKKSRDVLFEVLEQPKRAETQASPPPTIKQGGHKPFPVSRKQK